jgi:hypothetical protein
VSIAEKCCVYRCEEFPAEFETIGMLKENKPFLCEIWPTPPMWHRENPMKANLDAIMHMLFLGIIKTVVRMVMHWCKRRGKLNELLDQLKGTTEALMDLNLEWLRLLQFLGVKLGGMASENYMAICRIMPWLFCELRSVTMDFVFVPSINKPIWTAVECTSWLRVRDLPRSKMNADELRAAL